VRDDTGKPLRAAAATRAGQAVRIQFHDDEVGAVIAPGEVPPRKTGGKAGGKPAGGPGGSGGQGSLF